MGKTRRKKKHTEVAQDESALPSVPKTFVMERGKIGSKLNQLVLDLRRVMEPFTASKLKVRQRNVLKDFVQIAGPLGVTHFMIVSRTNEYVNLRVCRLPRGPTITFHMKAFSLCHEVLTTLRKPTSNTSQYQTPALLVLNNFSSDDRPSAVMATTFQNMFPSISIQTVKLADIRRCVLFHYDPSTKTIEFRHYTIKAVPRGISRSVKKLAHSRVPNLSKYQDISDYVLGGNVSESEGEEMGGEGEVTLPQDLPGRGNIKSEQSTIRLSEIGPRMSLQLVKIESGLCSGEVLHHEFVHKTKSETRALKRRIETKQRLREKRRSQQDANVLKKKREKEAHKSRCLAGQKQEGSSESDDDIEWYRQEVGEEPDPDVFVPSMGSKKRKAIPNKKFSPKAKKLKLDKDQRRKAKGRPGKTDKDHGQKGYAKRRPGESAKTGVEVGGKKRGGKFPGRRAQETEKPLVRFAGKKGARTRKRLVPPKRKVAAGRVFGKRAKAA